MLMPSKVVSVKESCLHMAVKILAAMDSNILVEDLYVNLNRKSFDVGCFLDALDLLFLLNRIELDSDSGVITRVK